MIQDAGHGMSMTMRKDYQIAFADLYFSVKSFYGEPAGSLWRCGSMSLRDKGTPLREYEGII
jgi:hypothetical protein